MNYDPSEMFREDPGESDLNPQVQAQIDLERQAEEQRTAEEARLQQEQSTPTGGQTQQAPQAEAATAPQEEASASRFKNPDGSINYEALDQEAAGLDTQDAELLLSIPTSLVDFGTDLINLIPGVNVPKITDFENQTTQTVREISSVVTPTLLGGAALKALGTAGNARVGLALGQNKFVQFMGERGVESLAGLAVGSVSREYEEDKCYGYFKESVSQNV